MMVPLQRTVRPAQRSGSPFPHVLPVAAAALERAIGEGDLCSVGPERIGHAVAARPFGQGNGNPIACVADRAILRDTIDPEASGRRSSQALPPAIVTVQNGSVPTAR
jgi:hypothetical protein